ncbi:hypothetical protein [Paenibacillus sp. FSL M7-0420]|uniref:hypothetical protein n=1 Tax=Paenibacillus sp. FSL M7-0420 TaxID=2921609 RepID=UPI0030F89C4B
MDYKNLLILVYFNSVQASYSYREISDNFGLSFFQVEDLINELQERDLLTLEAYYKLTSSALKLLKEYNMLHIDYFESLEVNSIFTKKPIGFDEIYIPVGFRNKIK